MSKLKTNYPKHNFSDPIILEKTSVYPSEQSEIKISVAKMPSDTRLYMHAFIYRSDKPGPTVLILGGVHGDEINGVEIAAQLNFEHHFTNLLSGNVIVIPLVNVFGFNNFSRDLPDGKDVNRNFPGSAAGSLASRVASTITKKIIPFCDYAIDLHTGGAERFNHPQVRYSSKEEGTKQLAEIFNAPMIIDQPMIANSFRKVATDHNVKTIVYEGGESVRLNGPSIDCGKQGVLNVLEHLGMITKPVKKYFSNDNIIKIKETYWQRASKSGIFIWSRCCPEFVSKGEQLGTIKDPYGYNIAPVISKYSGYIICHNNASVVNQGDALFHIATEYEENGF
jgi:predicted deacylase